MITSANLQPRQGPWVNCFYWVQSDCLNCMACTKEFSKSPSSREEPSDDLFIRYLRCSFCYNFRKFTTFIYVYIHCIFMHVRKIRCADFRLYAISTSAAAISQQLQKISGQAISSRSARDAAAPPAWRIASQLWVEGLFLVPEQYHRPTPAEVVLPLLTAT